MTLTAKIITACVIALGIYDLYAVSTGGVESSISRFMQDSGSSAPTIVFVVGYICGHIWGYMHPKSKKTGTITYKKDREDSVLEEVYMDGNYIGDIYLDERKLKNHFCARDGNLDSNQLREISYKLDGYVK